MRIKFLTYLSLWIGSEALLVDGFGVPTRRDLRLPSALALAAGADIEQSDAVTEIPAASELPPPNRGKVNEIDFCIAPADVSLSRSYSSSSAASDSSVPAQMSSMSLTRALNNASNRAVRRILLARSWPSAEALNLSLRQVLLAERAAKKEESKRSTPDIPLEDEDDQSVASRVAAAANGSSAKCPVPRPILNILMRRRNDPQNAVAAEISSDKSNNLPPRPRSRTDEEYVSDQIAAFREKYSTLPGYPLAEAYLECVLSLATSGVESARVEEVMAGGAYDESYRRVLAVLERVGVQFESVPGETERRRIASKLVDQDICLSMLDKLSLRKENSAAVETANNDVAKAEEGNDEVEQEVRGDEKLATTNSTAARGSEPVAFNPKKGKGAPQKSKTNEEGNFFLKFWRRAEEEREVDESDKVDEDQDEEETFELSPNDLGGVLLSAEEPSMTRQLNVLANIVQRTLLFGGDQELLVLSETLDADSPAFINRWYPVSDSDILLMDLKDETRPGVQFLNCLVQLLKNCYRDGVVTTLDPPLPLIGSYANAYERLVGSLVELGSGYIRPVVNVKSLPVPRTAQEELGRFAVWESTFRQNTPDITSYPDDLEGSWEVKDEIGGKTIGVSTVVLHAQGEVEVAPPMQGLRWRLDPGPTHLDTCTFQVLSDDGTILQYRGFIDRGARLEARYSKRPIRIRGSVMFQMRDGDNAVMGADYWKDMLPINYKTGTTKFVMTKQLNDKSK